MQLCAVCKGKKKLCGRDSCPILIKQYAAERLAKKLNGKKEYYGYTNFPFVGDFGYPNILAGPVLANEKDYTLFSSKEWYGRRIDDIIDFRVNMVRSKQKFDVKQTTNKQLEALQEITLSTIPVDTEVYFKKALRVDFGFDDIIAPVGPSGDIERMRICDNPKIPKQFDEAIEENMMANDAMNFLNDKGFDVDDISKILSVGVLGQKRKMVPTRWSITAADDTLSKQKIGEIKEFESIDTCYVFSDSFAGNHFEIIFAPGNWSFEMVEMYTPGCLWVTKGEGAVVVTDWEPYEGRKKYASMITGAYYAARLACTELLKEMKKQASVIVVREINPEYTAPLGVWVIRETCRNAMKNKTESSDLKSAASLVSSRMNTSNLWMKKSELFRRLLSRELFLKFV